MVWDGGSADEGGSTDEGGTATEGETVTVTTAEEFTAALADPNCAAITVSGWVEINGGSYTINKPLTTGRIEERPGLHQRPGDQREHHHRPAL